MPEGHDEDPDLPGARRMIRRGKAVFIAVNKLDFDAAPAMAYGLVG